jgi:hypothetical protein
MTWPSIYSGFRVAVLIWAGALVYLQSHALESARQSNDLWKQAAYEADMEAVMFKSRTLELIDGGCACKITRH